MKKSMKRIGTYLLVLAIVFELFSGNTLKTNAQEQEATVTTYDELQSAIKATSISTIYVAGKISLTKPIIIERNKEIYCIGNGSLWRDNANTAEMLYIKDGASVTLIGKDMTFLLDGNNVSAKTSAIRNDGILYMDNCTIQNCINENLQGSNGEWQGGAIANGNKLTIKNSVIKNNSAAWGGGIALFGSENYIYDCEIYNNSAIRGGGVFINENITSEDFVVIGTLNNGKTSIYDNEAVVGNIYDKNGNLVTNGGHGGGIYNQAVKEIILGNDVELYNNSAKDSGGGICNSKADYKSSSMVIKGSSLSGNSASKGGAVYSSSNLTINYIDCDMEKKNTAYDGGAVYNSITGTLNINGGRFTGVASNNGGGIYNVGTSTIKNILLNESSALNGGGIYNHLDGIVAFTDGTITNNSCIENGAGIYQGGRFFISNTAIVDTSNDVYLPDGKLIWVNEEITSLDKIATVTPEIYANGVKVVQDQFHASANDVYSSFALTPNGSYGLDADGQYLILAADYTVTFDVNGGKELADETKPKTVTYGETYGALPTPQWVDDTYKFAGWYTEKEGGTRILARSQVETEGDHTLYAHWTLADTYPYTVYFLDESIVDDMEAKSYMENHDFESYAAWETYRLADPLTVEHAGVKGATISIHDLVLPKVTGWCYSYSYPGDTLTLSPQPNENTFYCLYEREPITYTIRYLNKNTLAEINTETTGTASYGITLQTENLTKPSIPGYTYDSASVEALTMGLDESTNVITLYYTPNEQTYTVEYRSATTDKELKVADTFASYMDMEVGLSEIEKPLINGYAYSYASVDTLKIGADNSLNKCILYYTPDMTTYQVEYRSVTTDKELKVTDTFPSYVDMTITLDKITKPEIPGYTFKDASTESLIIRYDNSLNMLILYYEPNEQTYTVEYRSATIDQELMEASVVSSYMDTIVSLDEITKPQIPGYTYKHADKDSLTIACDNALNKFTLYYVPNLQAYTVEYRSITTGKELKPVSTFSAYMDTVISVNEIHKPDIYGYTYENASVASILMTYDNDQNNITLYYAPNQQTYTVEYRSATTGKILKEADTYSSYMDVELLAGELIKPEISGYTYQSASKESFVISHVNENNKVTLYYAPDEQTYTVEYRCANTGKALREADTYFSHTDSVIPLYEIEKPEIPGYTYKNANQENLTISYENASNRIILYYAPNVQTYTVEYRSVTTDKVLKPEETFSALMDTIVTLDAVKKPQLQGCTFVSASIATLVIGSDNALNRIIFQYAKVIPKTPIITTQENNKVGKVAPTYAPKQTVQVQTPATGDRTGVWCYVNCLLVGVVGAIFLQYRKQKILRTVRRES